MRSYIISILQRLDDYDSDVDEPDPDILYRIINTPIPNFKRFFTTPTNAEWTAGSNKWKGWWKFGAISAAAIATTTALATWSGVGITIYNNVSQQWK